MDPNSLNRLDFSLGPNSQHMDSLGQPNAETSSAGAAMQGSNDGSLWDPLSGLGMSDEINPAFLYAQQNQGGVPYGSFGGSSRAPRPADAIQMATAGRRRAGQHDRKRTKVGGSEAAALDSVDYWIHLDDDDQDSRLGGSFEIDFSRGRNEVTNFARYVKSNCIGYVLKPATARVIASRLPSDCCCFAALRNDPPPWQDCESVKL